jgi:hypothetical protein
MPFHAIRTPMHRRMKDESRITAVAAGIPEPLHERIAARSSGWRPLVIWR